MRRLRLDLLEVPWDEGKEIVRAEMDGLGLSNDGLSTGALGRSYLESTVVPPGVMTG